MLQRASFNICFFPEVKSSYKMPIRICSGKAIKIIYSFILGTHGFWLTIEIKYKSLINKDV
jgi:hypothetical protein